MKSHRIARLVIVSCIVLLPLAASAQQQATGTIAGIVKDTSGAVMSGVTVEATSPALIENVRIVVTDAQGQYKIVNLIAGTYSVTSPCRASARSNGTASSCRRELRRQ